MNFYLRILLINVAGPVSFEDLKTVPHRTEPCKTFKEACIERGLLTDDKEWTNCLRDACQVQCGFRIVSLFVVL